MHSVIELEAQSLNALTGSHSLRGAGQAFRGLHLGASAEALATVGSAGAALTGV